MAPARIELRKIEKTVVVIQESWFSELKENHWDSFWLIFVSIIYAIYYFLLLVTNNFHTGLWCYMYHIVLQLFIFMSLSSTTL